MFGTVDSFNDSRGYGFVRSKDGLRFFAHRTRINCPGYRTLIAGEEVSFDVEPNAKGLPRAVDVKPLAGGAQ